MPRTLKPEHVDVLMEQASEALTGTEYAAAERLAEQALDLAHTAGDYARMARIVLPLQEARRQQLQLALDLARTSGITILDAGADELVPTPGCYLFQPPLVAADARRFRLAALERGVPVGVLCREPLTQIRLCPVVAIGQATIRTKVEPPADPAAIDLPWFAEALELLGDTALETLDTGIEFDRQIVAIRARLDAHPHHEKLHQALADTCRLAAEEAARPAPRRKNRRAAADQADSEDGRDEESSSPG